MNIVSTVTFPKDPTLFRILTDGELPLSYGFGGKSRTAQPTWTGGAMTPATVKLHGVDPVTQFPSIAVDLVHKLNDPHNTFTYVTNTSAGWSNAGQIWPDKMEPIVFEGDIVKVTSQDVARNRAYLQMWNGETDPDVAPYVLHRWWNIDKDNHLNGTQNPQGDGIGYIVLAYPGVYYIELDRLTKL